MKTVDTEMIDRLKRLRENNSQNKESDNKKLAELRKRAFLATTKINTPMCKEAEGQIAKDQITIEQQNEGHNNYGE